ncbi:MAG TPA: hypothetical protein VGM77_01615 [Gemmatimonadales bacterium]|jgi:hypothetical protein
MRRRLLLALLLAAPLAPLAAQVGYLPTESPYRPIQHGSFLEGSVGRIYGGGGLLDVGNRDGTSYGLRYTLRAKNTLQFSFGGWTAGTVRNVVDANDSVATRNKGAFPSRLIAGEIGIQLNVTGGKTWHGAAPFAGVSFGIVHGGQVVSDTSGYAFGTKLFFAPTIGTRFFLGQSAYLRLDVRAMLWNLTYPPAYALEPSKQPGTTTNSNAVNPTGITSQYTITPEIRFGIGIVL